MTTTAPRAFFRRHAWKALLAIALLLVAGLWVAARVAAARLEPFVRASLVEYLEQRFHAQVRIGRLHASLPLEDPLRFLLRQGKGARVHVSVSDLQVVQNGLEDLPPLLRMNALRLELDFPSLWENTVLVKRLKLEDFHLVIPPKGRRPKLADLAAAIPEPAAGETEAPSSGDRPARSVVFEEVDADGMQLQILSANPQKAPLAFSMAHLRLFGAAPGAPMRYVADLTNPKPPGIVRATGTFGPFRSEEPGESPLEGEYSFEKADLSVFRGIVGTLHSTGKFSGQLNRIVAEGVTETPDFGLSYSSNRLPLRTRYHAIVDGANGDTELRPVEATIGSTKLLCEGAVERFPGEHGKTVKLRVRGDKGNLRDLLLLAMKDANAPLRGLVSMDLEITVPPGKQDYAGRLHLSGKFQVKDGWFTHKDTQAKLNEMSSRATGRPNQQPDDDITTDFEGRFVLSNRILRLSDLRFYIPGAAVTLDGAFNLGSDELDFHGLLRTDARLSQMMKSRWKRWVLKPVDPFFAKDGAGAQFKIAVTGSRDNPNFGLDRGK